MKPASDADAQAVHDAVAAGDPIPPGYGFDGANVYVVEDSDEQRIEAGGNVMPPDYENPPAVEGTPSTTTTKTKASG